MIEDLFAIFAFCYIFNLLPAPNPPAYGAREIVNVLGLALIVVVMLLSYHR